MKIGNQSHAHTNIPETRKALARLLIWQIELTGNSQTKLARFVKNWIPTAVVNRSCTMLSTIRSGAKHLDQDVRVNDNALKERLAWECENYDGIPWIPRRVVWVNLCRI